MKTFPDLISDLSSLEIIIQKLLENNIKGDRESYCTCPLAKYLNQEIQKEIPWARVETFEHTSQMINGVWTDMKPNTPAMIEFINAFDDGKLPEFDQNISPANPT